VKWITTGRPRVTLKAAVTLDGRLAAAGGDSKWITGESARLQAHRLRDASDAILVGAGTVRADDPRLTTRLPGGRGRDPLRVVVAGRLQLPPAAAVLAPGTLIAAVAETQKLKTCIADSETQKLKTGIDDSETQKLKTGIEIL